jgi:hypothetical protein
MKRAGFSGESAAGALFSSISNPAQMLSRSASNHALARLWRAVISGTRSMNWKQVDGVQEIEFIG